MSGEAKAIQPEDVTRLVAERLNAGDAAPGRTRAHAAPTARRYRGDATVTSAAAFPARLRCVPRSGTPGDPAFRPPQVGDYVHLGVG